MTITRPGSTDVQQRTVSLTIDGRSLTVAEGRRSGRRRVTSGIDIPMLCHDERYDPVGVCRMCVVDVGGRVDAAACIRPCESDMDVATATPEIQNRRKVLTELLVDDQPPRDEDPKQTTTADNELLAVADGFAITDVGRPAFRDPPAAPTCPIR